MRCVRMSTLSPKHSSWKVRSRGETPTKGASGFACVGLSTSGRRGIPKRKQISTPPHRLSVYLGMFKKMLLIVVDHKESNAWLKP